MDQIIPSLSALLDPFAVCFRQEVAETFRALVVAWTLCPGRHTLSEVWQATGWAARRHHDIGYAVFHSAKWDWDDLGKLLVALVVARLIPTGAIWVVVDDTLTHKRGAHVALGGFYLDAVASSKRRKVLRFGINWVVVGLAVHLPFRPDRTFCLPVLWRAYRKAGTPGHRKRTALAADLARAVAACLPGRECWLVGDGAYVNAATLRGRPANLQVIGPLRWDAALYAPPPPRRPGQRGRDRLRGDRLPTPKAMIDDPAGYRPTHPRLRFAGQSRRLRVQVVRDVLWYAGAKSEPLTLVLVRDPSGAWRDSALVATDPEATAVFVIAGYCRRWSIEVAFRDSKQHLGLHDPQVWCERSVERAHPMAWLVQSLTVLWYATAGRDGPHVRRDRPWYKRRVAPTFTDMLGALRLQLWDARLNARSGDEPLASDRAEFLLHWLAAVR